MKLKQKPGDFRVREVLRDDFAPVEQLAANPN